MARWGRRVIAAWRGRPGLVRSAAGPAADAPVDAMIGRPRADAVVGRVDEPTSGSTVPAQITIRGWSTWRGRPALAVAARLDGRLVGQGLVGSEARPDVAEALAAPDLVAAGWRFDADLGPIDAPRHAELRLAVWVDPDLPPVALAPMTLVLDPSAPRPGGPTSAPPEITGALDRPRHDDLVGPHTVRVQGWALHRERAVSRVDIIVNGRWSGRARLGLPRPDVATTVAGAHGSTCGFEHVVELTWLAPATRTVTIQAVAAAGGGPPLVVDRRCVALAAAEAPPARAERDLLLEQRRRQLVGPRRPREDGLDLIVFTHHLGFGGAQLWLDELLTVSGAGTDYPCTVIAPHDGPLRPELERRGVAVHVTEAHGADDIEAYEGRRSELSALVGAAGHNAALINTASSFLGADVTTGIGLPTVWAIHESLEPRVFLETIYREALAPEVGAAMARALAATDALIFEAEATRRLWTPWAGQNRTAVVHYGVDTAAIESYCRRTTSADAKADVGVAGHLRLLLVMGTFEPRKAQVRIVQAFARVAAQHPGWHLVLVGDTASAYAAAVHEAVVSAGLAGRVRLVGVVEDTYRWYRAADALLSASDLESLPRSVLEAMAFGLPVVSTSVFGLPELIDDGTTGFLFEPNDLDAAVTALQRVLGSDPAELAAVGDASRQKVRTGYDSTGYATDVMTLVGGVSGAAHCGPADLLVPRNRPPSRSGIGVVSP